MRTSKPVDAPEAPPALPLTKEVARRWAALRRRAAPLLSPVALATGLSLAGSLLLAGMLQFGTGVLEDHPDFAMAWAGLNAAWCVVLALQFASRRPWLRGHTMLAIGTGTALLVSLGSLGGKLQYQRGLQGNPFYTLPHAAAHYPVPTTDVLIRASDGVRLQGTLIATQHPRAIVIYPTWRTNRDAFSVMTLASWLSNQADVLVLDPRGQGASEGAKSPAGDEKFDVLAGVAFMRASGHERVGVLAEQEGAYPAVLAAGLHQGIDSLAIVDPTGTWGESLGEVGHFWDPRHLPGRFYWRIAAGLRLAAGADGPTAIEAVHQIAPTPVLFCAPKNEPGGTLDQWQLAAADPKSLMLYGGDGKPTTWRHFDAYYQTLDQWFNLTLRPKDAVTGAPPPAAPAQDAPAPPTSP